MRRRALLLAAYLLAFSGHEGCVMAQSWHAEKGYRWESLSVPAVGKAGFREIPVERSGITFTNELPEERYLTNQILLNGSGVAAGDVDGDGLCDLFFCGIDRPSVLYRNLGNFKFVDITRESGVSCEGQATTGAAFADVDGDGHLDLLVNGLGAGTRLFLNDGKGHFREVTDEWGLRSHRGSMSLALGDIDGDGFLDLYEVNYRSSTVRDELEVKLRTAVTNNHYTVLAVNGRPATEPDLEGRYTVDPVMGLLENGETDVLFRNTGHGRFAALNWTDGTFLDEDGRPSAVPYDWGLSAMFRDINGDGAPDLYVCNDFHSPDRIWLNNGHGRFQAIPRLALRQTSLFSMGIDFADVDRDGRDDFFVADMLSRRHVNRQVQLMDRRASPLPLGAIENRPQYSRNTMFWNRGDGTYAEVAQYCGLQASDWTWCPVFLDVDLDGYEDLLMVTGHLRDAQNIDISRQIDALKRGRRLPHQEQLKLRRLFKPLTIANLAFRNRGQFQFEEVGHDWGFDSTRISQGIALADLDNDGDLDVAVNCLNAPPLVLQNTTERPRVAVRLRGLPPNTHGIGSRILVSQVDLPEQSQEIICGGRYLSSDDAVRVFAAASPESTVTIKVFWRSGRVSVLAKVSPNRIYELDEAEAKPGEIKRTKVSEPLFSEVSEVLRHQHVEEPYDDFQRQPLLPHKLSQLGPGVSWFDLDEDGWEDLLIPAGKGGKLAAFRNNRQGGFQPFAGDLFSTTWSTDLTTVLGWLFQKGKANLFLSSSDYRTQATNNSAVLFYDLQSKELARRFPIASCSPGPLALADPAGEGRLQLFVGGRVIPGRFPAAADSMLLSGGADGNFYQSLEATNSLSRVGLVSGAIWTDLDGDGIAELVLACEAGPIRVFKSESGKLREITGTLGLTDYTGLWNSVVAGDFDGDGRLDLVAGNWGRNTKYQSYLKQPIHFYYGDLVEDGRLPVVEAYFDDELKKVVPWRDWESLSSVLPLLKERYGSFTAFSSVGVEELFQGHESEVRDWSIRTLDSMVFINRGDHFEAHPLPDGEAQFAPVFGVAVGDLDGDGNEDLVLSQNLFGLAPLDGRLDGGRGLWLRGDGKGGFTGVSARESGIAVYGEGRGLALCDFDHDGRVDLVITQNGNSTRLFRNKSARPGLRVQLRGGTGNALGIGAQLRIEYEDGRLGPVRETHAGSGYWSQDAAVPVLGINGLPKSVRVRWPGGRISRVAVPAGALSIVVESAAGNAGG